MLEINKGLMTGVFVYLPAGHAVGEKDLHASVHLKETREHGEEARSHLGIPVVGK